MAHQIVKQRLIDLGVTQGHCIRTIKEKKGENINSAELSRFLGGINADTPKGRRILQYCNEIADEVEKGREWDK